MVVVVVVMVVVVVVVRVGVVMVVVVVVVVVVMVVVVVVVRVVEQCVKSSEFYIIHWFIHYLIYTIRLMKDRKKKHPQKRGVYRTLFRKEMFDKPKKYTKMEIYLYIFN